MTDFFTSDTHFGHANIIKYSKRPYKTVEEMDAELIANWNSVVKPEDRVFHLGDLAFASEARTMRILEQLAGQKFLCFGNHDKAARRSPGIQRYFSWCHDYHELNETIDGRSVKVVLCHYPFISWNGMRRGSYMLHGHCHGSLRYPFTGRIMDVGVDPQNLYPISIDKVHRRLESFNVHQLDHHGDQELPEM